jgi:hypothetical protein
MVPHPPRPIGKFDALGSGHLQPGRCPRPAGRLSNQRFHLLSVQSLVEFEVNSVSRLFGDGECRRAFECDASFPTRRTDDSSQ